MPSSSTPASRIPAGNLQPDRELNDLCHTSSGTASICLFLSAHPREPHHTGISHLGPDRCYFQSLVVSRLMRGIGPMISSSSSSLKWYSVHILLKVTVLALSSAAVPRASSSAAPSHHDALDLQGSSYGRALRARMSKSLAGLQQKCPISQYPQR